MTKAKAKPSSEIVNFFKTHLRHTKGEWSGQPFKLQPW